MTLIAKIGDLEIYSFIVALTSDASAGFKHAFFDNMFQRGPIAFMQISLIDNFQAYKVGVTRRLDGTTLPFTALFSEADGFSIAIYQPDAVSRTYRLNIFVGVKR